MTRFRQHPDSTARLRVGSSGVCSHSGPLVHLEGRLRTDRDTATLRPCKWASFGMSRRPEADARCDVLSAFRWQVVSAAQKSRQQKCRVTIYEGGLKE